MNKLPQSLSVIRGAGLMLNIVIGAGLLALPGLVVKQAGGHALWAWGAAALLSIPLLLVFTIMGQRFPNAGGIAHFVNMAFGSLGYMVASAIFLGAVLFGLPAITLTGGYYLAEVLLGNPTLYAVMFIISSALMHTISTEVAGRISTIFASSILLCLGIFMVIGAWAIEWDKVSDNIVPFAELEFGLVFAPFMMIFFAFTGWETAAGISEEFKNPRRDFPRAMALSFLVACFLYLALAFIIQNASISGAYEAAFVSVAETVFGKNGKLVIALLAALIIFANVIGLIWAVSRVIFALSRDNYLPIKLTTNKHGSPVSSVMIFSVSPALVLTLNELNLVNLSQMLALAGQNFLILFGMASIALFKLSGNVWDRAIALITTLIVIVLLFIEGRSIVYPLFLSVLAFMLWYVTKRKAKP